MTRELRFCAEPLSGLNWRPLAYKAATHRPPGCAGVC